MEVTFNQCSETNLPLLAPLRLFNSFAILMLITEHGLSFVGSFNIFTFFLFIQLTLEQMLAFDNDVKYQLNPAITADHIGTFLLTSVR